MLFKTLDKTSGKVLKSSRPLMLDPKDAYVRPAQGRDWFATTTTIWQVDEIIKRRVRDWRRLTGETGHDGARNQTFRADHNSVYTGTHSVFPAPLMEMIIMRYGGPVGSHILDPFAGGPPRGIVAAIMGHQYTGIEIRQEQIDENERTLKNLKLSGANYHCSDGRCLDWDSGGKSVPPIILKSTPSFLKIYPVMPHTPSLMLRCGFALDRCMSG
jgi:hypothetical protein